MKWQKLQEDFLAIVKQNDGPMKSSCGTINVYYGNPSAFERRGIFVILGGYCIGDWSRNEELGPFKTEEEAGHAFDEGARKLSTKKTQALNFPTPEDLSKGYVWFLDRTAHKMD